MQRPGHGKELGVSADVESGPTWQEGRQGEVRARAPQGLVIELGLYYYFFS